MNSNQTLNLKPFLTASSAKHSLHIEHALTKYTPQ